MQVYVRAIEDVAETWSSIRQIPNYEIVVGEALFRHLFELEPAAVKLYSFGREDEDSDTAATTTTTTSTDKNNHDYIDIEAFLQTPGFKVHAIGVVAMLGAVVGMMATAASTTSTSTSTSTSAATTTLGKKTTANSSTTTNISRDNSYCSESSCCCNSSIETTLSVEDDILSELAQSISTLGSRHVHHYGVVPGHFNALETALLRTLRGGLEPSGRWTTNARKGWSAVLKFIATGMQQGAVFGQTIQIVPPTLTARRGSSCPPPPQEICTSPSQRQRKDHRLDSIGGVPKDRLPTPPSRERPFVHATLPDRRRSDEEEDTDDEQDEEEEHEARIALKVVPTPSSPPPPSKIFHHLVVDDDDDDDADDGLLSIGHLDLDAPPTSRRRWSSDGRRPIYHHDHRSRRPPADDSPSPPSRSTDHILSLLELPFDDYCHPNDLTASNTPLPSAPCTMKRRQSEPGFALARSVVDTTTLGVVPSTKYCVDQAPRMPRRNSDLPEVPSASASASAAAAAAAAAAACVIDYDDDDDDDSNYDSDYDNEDHDSNIPFRSKQSVDIAVFDSNGAKCGGKNFVLSSSLSPYYDPKPQQSSSSPKHPERSPSPTISLYVSSYSPATSSVALPSSATSSPSMTKSPFVRRIDSLPVLPRRFDDEEDGDAEGDDDHDCEDLNLDHRDIDNLPLSTSSHCTTPSRQKQKRVSVTTVETLSSSPGPEDSDTDEGEDEDEGEGDDGIGDNHEQERHG